MAMGRHRLRVPAAALLVVLLALGGARATSSAAVASAQTTPDTLSVTGFGWGHNRGLSQWGSLGYAVDHGWTYSQILDHYYSNTEAGSSTTDTIRVRLTAWDGIGVTAAHPDGVSIAGTGLSAPAIRVTADGAGFLVSIATSCGGPWTAVPVPDGAVALIADGTDPLVTCSAGGTLRWYRGRIVVTRGTEGEVRTVNHVGVDDYLRGVVPRESPAGWGYRGDGAGLHALRAQSVAARSYALSEHRYSYAETCDTTSCQVYGGHAYQFPDQAQVALEHPNTDQAVADTTGEVRTFIGTGATARTEFSASTGGATLDVDFPPVVDAGDHTEGNPVHHWTHQIRATAIEAAWPAIGDFTGARVTERTGVGHSGGPAVTIRVEGTGGEVEVSAASFRSRLRHHGACTDPAAATGCVKSVYVFLGSEADHIGDSPPGGLTVGDRGTRIEVPLPGAPRQQPAPADGEELAPIGPPSTSPEPMPMKPSIRSVADRRTSPAGISNGGDGWVWLATGDGDVIEINGAPDHGDVAAMPLNAPMIDIAARPDGRGFWMVAADGGVFSFGSSRFHGSTGGTNVPAPVVAMTATPSGEGYWLVGADGSVYPFGDAGNHGSMAGIPLNRPMIGIISSPTGQGYLMFAGDGGVFAFGDGAFKGSTGSTTLDSPAVDVRSHPDGRGYWLVTEKGSVHAFGVDALGDLSTKRLTTPVVGFAVTPDGEGYQILQADGDLWSFGTAR
ncbi:MAG: hypothetical protein GY929_06195 [Actinomycetia bacterium]|nr:hypothetical protein [Actinomycetes bacterium]